MATQETGTRPATVVGTGTTGTTTTGRGRTARAATAAARSRSTAWRRATVRQRTILRWIAGAVTVLLLAGCSGSDSGGLTFSTSDTRGGEADAPDAMPAPQDDDVAIDDAGDLEVAEDGAVRAVTAGAPTGQKVIRTAELVLESSDTSETLGRVRAVAERAGGYTATSDLQRDMDGVVRGTVTLRVPTDELSAVVEQLEELGEAVPVNRIDERDVTTEHADLRARIDNLTAYETELRALLTEIRASTDRPEDLLHIFERIRQVREEIDLLEGRMAALSDQIAYATVTVTLRPIDEVGGPGDQEASPWAPGETFREALAATARLLAALADGLIWFVVTGVPVLVSFLGVPAVAVYLIVRWVRRRPQQPREAATASPAANGTEATGTPPTA
jgi:hypothetical protein